MKYTYTLTLEQIETIYHFVDLKGGEEVVDLENLIEETINQGFELLRYRSRVMEARRQRRAAKLIVLEKKNKK